MIIHKKGKPQKNLLVVGLLRERERGGVKDGPLRKNIFLEARIKKNPKKGMTTKLEKGGGLGLSGRATNFFCGFP